jgi:hypothetical protein
MAKSLKYNAEWTQVVIEDPKAIPGTSIFNIIKLLQNAIAIKFILLSDVERPCSVSLSNAYASTEVFIG